MALQLPANLKIPEIQRFAVRASQLEKYRPIVTYWCEYHILQTVLSRQLHTIDDECQNYALQLMDKLESYKAANSSNDAIVDDVAAKAYMENFALETFGRADDAQRANKVTKQTADTFMAAATFLDLLSIWGEVEKEVSAKSKFAKFHAARILKAFKAGEDPNATNPVVEEPPAPAENGLEDELRDLERQESEVGGSSYQPPSVEHVDNEAHSPGPRSSAQVQPPAPPTKIKTPTQYEPYSAPPPGEHEVSPIDPPTSSNHFIDPPPEDDNTARQNSIGGGYFPSVADEPPAPPSPPPTTDPQDFYNTNAEPQPPPSAPSLSSFDHGSDIPPSQSTTDCATTPGLTSPYTQPPPPAAPIIPQPAVVPPPPPVQPVIPQSTQYSGPPPGGYKNDDESTMLAQKHARWAISALNFEDVNTAVKELRLALQSLGAT
jgi:vacuolar protein sorting-associated protein VTA1